jgi:hypothetical protein
MSSGSGDQKYFCQNGELIIVVEHLLRYAFKGIYRKRATQPLFTLCTLSLGSMT